MAVIKTERARREIPFAGFALKDAELSVEMPDIVESLFDEQWNCIAVGMKIMEGDSAIGVAS